MTAPFCRPFHSSTREAQRSSNTSARGLRLLKSGEATPWPPHSGCRGVSGLVGKRGGECGNPPPEMGALALFVLTPNRRSQCRITRRSRPSRRHQRRRHRANRRRSTIRGPKRPSDCSNAAFTTNWKNLPRNGCGKIQNQPSRSRTAWSSLSDILRIRVVDSVALAETTRAKPQFSLLARYL